MYVILYFNYTQLYINNIDNSIHYVHIVHNCTRDFFFPPITSTSYRASRLRMNSVSNGYD